MQTYVLKDNSIVTDRRLDRILHFDEESRVFPIMSAIKARRERNRAWRCNTYLDQGSEGACVGFGICHELLSSPAAVQNIDAKYAIEKVYWPAQHIDPFPGGSYPGAKPKMDGTSVLAGVKVVHSLGWFDSYRWGFGIYDLIMGVGYNGPAVIGVNWYEGMQDTDENGYIHVSGRQTGGHCILVRGVNVDKKYFILHNSWGLNWGLSGECLISFDDMDKLLQQKGEVVFFQNRHTTPRMK